MSERTSRRSERVGPGRRWHYFGAGVLATAVRRVELRRHSVRTIPEEDLSAEGRALAADEGRRTGPFRLVVSSPTRRAVQTAEAMGYPTPRIDPTWGPAGGDPALQSAWPVSFAGARVLLQRNESTRRLGVALWHSVRRAIDEVRPEEGILIVTHGGLPEVAAVSAFPHADPGPWGGALRCMEGVRIAIEGAHARSIEVLRVADARTRV